MCAFHGGTTVSATTAVGSAYAEPRARRSPGRAKPTSARRAQPFGAAALCVLASAACSAAPAPVLHTAPAPPVPAQTRGAAADAGGQPSCPRLPRASRIWTGFAADVPPAPLHLTLDAVVPIQEGLGALFCGPEREPCRPAALLSIELTDAGAQSARVQLDTGGATPSVLQLRLRDETWQAEAQSLAAFMRSCTPTRR